MFRWLSRLYTGLTGAGRRIMSGVWSGRRGDPPLRGTQEFLELYRTSPWLRAVAGKTAAEVGSTVWTAKVRGRDVAENHIALQTLRKPNPVLTGHQLFKVTQLSLDLVGDAFWFVSRNAFGIPVEFWPIPPHWVIETPTPANPRFRLGYQAWQEEVPDTEILWMHDAAPDNPYTRGSGTAQAQADELETHEYASKHAKQIFFNRAIPEFVVMDDGASDEEIDTHDRAFNQRLRGFWRWYKPYFTNRKLEFWQPQQMNLDNLTMVPLLKHERDVLIQSWGFPPEQLGIVENSNRSTIDASDYVLQARIVRPRRVFLRDCLNLHLAPQYPRAPGLMFDFVDTVPADKEYQLKVATKAPHAPDLDEWRGLMGLPPVGGKLGRARMVPLNSYLAEDPLDPESRPQAGAGGRRAGDQPAPGEGEEPEDEPAEVTE